MWIYAGSVEWRLVYGNTLRQRGRNLIINKRFCRLRESHCVLSLFVCHTFLNVCMILSCNAFRRLRCRRLVTWWKKLCQIHFDWSFLTEVVDIFFWWKVSLNFTVQRFWFEILHQNSNNFLNSNGLYILMNIRHISRIFAVSPRLVERTRTQ